MYNNYKKLFKGKGMKDQLYKAAFSSNIQQFNDAMEQFKEYSAEAFGWVSQKNLVH